MVNHRHPVGELWPVAFNSEVYETIPPPIPFMGLVYLPTPIGSMYGIFTYIYHKNEPNVGKYTIHGSLGT